MSRGEGSLPAGVPTPTIRREIPFLVGAAGIMLLLFGYYAYTWRSFFGFGDTLRFYAALFDSYRDMTWVVGNYNSQHFPHVALRLARAAEHDWSPYLPLLRAISLTYRVSDDYKLVAVAGADLALDPWLMGQDTPQLIFLRGSGGGMNFSVHYHPENTWHLLRPGDGTQPESDVTLTQDQADTLRMLAPKYSTLYLQPNPTGMMAEPFSTTITEH